MAERHIYRRDMLRMMGLGIGLGSAAVVTHQLWPILTVEGASPKERRTRLGQFAVPLNAHDFGDRRTSLDAAIQLGVPVIEGNVQWAHGRFYLDHDESKNPEQSLQLQELLEVNSANGVISLLDCKNSVTGHQNELKVITDDYAQKSPIWVCSKKKEIVDQFRQIDGIAQSILLQTNETGRDLSPQTLMMPQ